jgi:hypothetical protein
MCADCVRLAEKYEHRVHLEPRINGQHAVPVDVPPSAAQLWCRVCCPRTEAVRPRADSRTGLRKRSPRYAESKIRRPAI